MKVINIRKENYKMYTKALLKNAKIILTKGQRYDRYQFFYLKRECNT